MNTLSLKFLLLPVFCAISFMAHCQNLSSTATTVRLPHNEDKSYQLSAVQDNPVLIELASGENFIEPLVRSNPGDDAWEIFTQGNRLFVTPFKGATRINLTALTAKTSFNFEITPVPNTPKNLPLRIARLVIEEKPAPKKVPPPSVAKNLPQESEQRLSTEIQPVSRERRNREYSLQIVTETVDVRPREVFDNGKFTFFKFPANMEIPAIYKSIPDTKEEWIVNSHREGDYLVMQSIAPLWTLRIGGTVLGIFNDAYDVVGADHPGTTKAKTLQTK